MKWSPGMCILFSPVQCWTQDFTSVQFSNLLDVTGPYPCAALSNKFMVRRIYREVLHQISLKLENLLQVHGTGITGLSSVAVQFRKHWSVIFWCVPSSCSLPWISNDWNVSLLTQHFPSSDWSVLHLILQVAEEVFQLLASGKVLKHILPWQTF